MAVRAEPFDFVDRLFVTGDRTVDDVQGPGPPVAVQE